MIEVVESKHLPISKQNVKTREWVFVEMFYGSYRHAFARMRELQGSKDAIWQYRIWDCR